MKQEVLKNFNLTYLTVTAEILFLTLFVAFSWFALSRKDKFKVEASLPFKEEEIL